MLCSSRRTSRHCRRKRKPKIKTRARYVSTAKPAILAMLPRSPLSTEVSGGFGTVEVEPLLSDVPCIATTKPPGTITARQKSRNTGNGDLPLTLATSPPDTRDGKTKPNHCCTHFLNTTSTPVTVSTRENGCTGRAVPNGYLPLAR